MMFKRLFLNALMFWLPIPVTTAMAIVWWRFSGDLKVVAVAVLLPLVYGYVMPFIGINILKNWQFKGGWRIGGMYVHHGFMYASKLSFYGFVPLLILSDEMSVWAFNFSWLVITSILYACTAWLQDHLSFAFGIVIFPKSNMHLNVNRYALVCFSLIGLLYTIGLVICYHMNLKDSLTPSYTLALLTVQFLLMLIIPGLLFRFLSNRSD